MKVFVGISGGVDSAVSAALLQKEGFDVTGVFIKIQIPGYPCPAAKDRIEAMRVVAHLRIPFIEIDLSKEYQEEVFKLSLKEFERGRTPNPDAICNREIKFGAFYDFAKSRGADFVATGHYAQIAPAKPVSQKVLGSPSGSAQPDHFAQQVLLLAGTDKNKDQSYFLWAVPETYLRHTMFPVGHLQKSEVRALAEKFGLPNAVRPDSQGLCFLGDIGIEDMLSRELTHKEGDVLNEAGEVVGTHRGVRLYTLGERHGFSLFPTTAHAKAQYVIKKDITNNTLMVSPNKYPTDARATEITLTETNWIGDVGEGPCFARYRYRQTLIPALIKKNGEAVKVILKEPHYVPLGQSLVLYQGERCLGGGVIDNATMLK